MLIELRDRLTGDVPIVLDDQLAAEAMVQHNPDRFIRVEDRGNTEKQA